VPAGCDSGPGGRGDDSPKRSTNISLVGPRVQRRRTSIEHADHSGTGTDVSGCRRRPLAQLPLRACSRVVLDPNADRTGDSAPYNIHDGRAAARGGGAGIAGAMTTTERAQGFPPVFCADLVRNPRFCPHTPRPCYPACGSSAARCWRSSYAFNVEILRVRGAGSGPALAGGNAAAMVGPICWPAPGHGGVEGNSSRRRTQASRVRDFRLPVEPLSRLIDEHQFDLYKHDPMPVDWRRWRDISTTQTASALLSLAARVGVAFRQRRSIIIWRAMPGLAQGNRPGDCRATTTGLPSRRQLFRCRCNCCRQHGKRQWEEVFFPASTDAASAHGDRSADRGGAPDISTPAFDLPRRGAGGGERPIFLPLAPASPRKLKADVGGADVDPFVPRANVAVFRILWTLWRAVEVA